MQPRPWGSRRLAAPALEQGSDLGFGRETRHGKGAEPTRQGWWRLRATPVPQDQGPTSSSALQCWRGQQESQELLQTCEGGTTSKKDWDELAFYGPDRMGSTGAASVLSDWSVLRL